MSERVVACQCTPEGKVGKRCKRQDPYPQLSAILFSRPNAVPVRALHHFFHPIHNSYSMDNVSGPTSLGAKATVSTNMADDKGPLSTRCTPLCAAPFYGHREISTICARFVGRSGVIDVTQ